MLATTMTEARSPEDKLRWAFRLYDKDGSGVKEKSFHIFHYYATQNLTSKNFVICIFRNYWFRGDDRNHHKSLLTWRTDTGGWCQKFWFFWKVWSWRCLLFACLLMSIDICWPKDGDTPRRQFCLSRVKIETWTVNLVALLGLASLSNV